MECRNFKMFTGFDSFVGETVQVQRSGQSGIDGMHDMIDMKYRFCCSGHSKN